MLPDGFQWAKALQHDKVSTAVLLGAVMAAFDVIANESLAATLPMPPMVPPAAIDPNAPPAIPDPNPAG